MTDMLPVAMLPVPMAGGSWLGVFGGGLIGLVLGLVLQRTHYCTMGALSDLFLFGAWRRLRVWLLACGFTLLGTQVLDAAGLIDPAASFYRHLPLAPLALIGGGMLFGIGMVLAGGCVGRTLIRLGSGSLKALFVLFAMTIATAATLTGIAAAPAGWAFAIALPVDPARSGPAALAHTLFGWSPTWLDPALAVAIGLPLIALTLRRQIARGEGREARLGLVIAAACIAAWMLDARLQGAASAAPEVPAQGVNFVGPGADLLVWATTGGGVLPQAGVVLILGVIVGAFLSAWRSDGLRLETFSDASDMKRHAIGGLAMGVGGALAGGCTFGQGLSGTSTLAASSLLALAGMIGGCRWALFWLEHGRWWPVRRPARPADGP
ncbi:MAG: YeeE/YedE family protein [Geminicoccaceae bacterium]|nr:YeeE/YedE family protein [Geminicoccaceae bacterium]